MGDVTPEKKSGCGLLNAVFGRRSIWPRRSTSTGSLHQNTANVSKVTRNPSTPIPVTQAEALLGTTHRNKPAAPKRQQQSNYNNVINTPRKVPPKTGLGISGELETMIVDHQRSNGVGGSLVRASSSNVMLIGNLGNLRQQQGESLSKANDHYAMNKSCQEREPAVKSVSLCRALSTRMDPEQLKILGNEDYKNGRFAEAVALYDAAISIDPNKASYRSNKSAALTALGKLLEAALECREAIRIDPFYQRAHNRLATLYVRLGEAEKAMHHFKQSGEEADPDAINKAKEVQLHLNKCSEAKRQRDWNTLLKEASLAIAAGADSAPLIFALKAEAFLKLNKHQEANDTMVQGPSFEVDECTKFFGPIGSSILFLVRAQVDMVAGRFEDAVTSAQRASRLNSNNREANTILRRAKAVASARSNGNELFKSARYSEACITYGEGLNHDPYNAVLLCNRAACRSKLCQYEKAIEDCSAALKVRSNFDKARLRRADCYAKVEKWEACIQDCEELMKVNPDDEEVKKILKNAQEKLGNLS